MRAMNWLILALVLAMTIWWFGFHQRAPEATEVVVVENEVPTSVFAPATLGQVDDARVASQAADDGNWLTHGRTFEEQRFSPLTQINRETVPDLGLAWFRDMATNRTLEATPIVVDGVMFFTGAWSRVYAMSADDGELLWSFDPKVAGEWGRRTCCDVINRGVAVYQGKVYVGVLDGRLIALDANSGERLWTVDTSMDRSRDYSITGAPRVANGKVFIGNSGAEYGVRGYASAYDADSGELLWRFFTVPGDPSEPFEHPEMELAAKTWTGSWWEHGGGGTVWNSIVYDPEFDQVYLGTGNGAPWSAAIRSPGGGDNLFLASIVAVDADTGRMNWYYQEVPAENWDYTATQDMVLADMEVDGKMRKVLLQAPKNGFFYVLDRTDGTLLRAHPFATVNWATHVDMDTGRPVLNPQIDYLEKARWVLPGPLGAHNWQAMSVDVGAGLVYLPVQDIPFIYAMPEDWQKTGLYQRRKGQWNLGVELERVAANVVENIGAVPGAAKGYLKAFDPLTGEARWTVELPHYWNGGVLATKGGLVFQGDAQGYLSAYDKDTGEVLWQFNTYTSILAAPVTYTVDDVQYVAILTGTGGGDLFGPGLIDAGETLASGKYGNAGRMLVFSLGGTEQLQPPALRDRSIPEQVLTEVSDQDLASGERLYFKNCAACHGFAARAAGAGIPDLRLMSPATHETFPAIVLGGSRMSNGMDSFANVLTAGEAELIHQYIRARAFEDREQLLGNKEMGRLSWQ
jgi:PQQ-dependent dehydrogenase (methanol/ethanol family)